MNLGDLYRTRGEYSGWNWRAIAATLLGCFFAWIGLIIPTLRPLYDYGWFVGFGVAFVSYLAMMRIRSPITEVRQQ
jgi:NCS1 family nucleobase:cation symporter-1